MKKLLFFIMVLSFAACSKDDFDAGNPKNGQKAELYVDHYSDVRNQMIFLYPQKDPSPLGLRGFEEREFGYTYKVKAKAYVSSEVVMDDGTNSWFNYDGMISKERYTSQDRFEIGLVYHIGFGGSGGNLAIKQEDDKFLYGAGGTLRPANAAIRQQLADLLLREKAIGTAQEYQDYQLLLNTLALKAVVTHDPENYGKGYLVHEIKQNLSI